MEVKNLLVAIVNHNHNQEGIALKKSFAPYVSTVLIDSGSTFQGDEAAEFDYRLANVYYNGLMNQAYELLQGDLTHMLFVTSDVEILDTQALVQRIVQVYNTHQVGVYAPSARHSTHGHMNHQKGKKGLRRVTFTEGFCFAMPKSYMDDFCPIDLSVNKIGHGIDMYLGFLSMDREEYALVDDSIVVHHPHGSGYSAKEARIQRDNWYATKSKRARFFHHYISKDILKNAFGFYFVRFLMRFVKDN